MRKNKRNQDIRKLIDKSGLYYWEVAEHLGITPSQFSCLLRYPLEPEIEAEIRKIVATGRNMDNEAI